MQDDMMLARKAFPAGVPPQVSYLMQSKGARTDAATDGRWKEIFKKKLPKHLAVRNKVLTFAPAFPQKEASLKRSDL